MTATRTMYVIDKREYINPADRTTTLFCLTLSNSDPSVGPVGGNQLLDQLSPSEVSGVAVGAAITVTYASAA